MAYLNPIFYFQNEDRCPALKGLYKIKKKIGEGSYSQVYKAIDLKSKQKVAVKRIMEFDQKEGFPRSALREIAILKDLNHENVIKIRDVVNRGLEELYLILDYMKMDLYHFISDKRNECLSKEMVRSYLYQLCSGLEHCHAHRVVHRDLKTANLLIDKLGNIKITDFGISKQTIVPRIRRKRSKKVTALWYRAPEVLFKCPHYGSSLDIWSLACVFAEMCIGDILFHGDSDTDQVLTLFRTLSTPNDDTFPDFSRTPIQEKLEALEYPVMYGNHLESECGPFMLPEQLTLLKKMLVYHPDRRPSCSDLMRDEFFEGFDKNVRVRPGKMKRRTPLSRLK